MCWQVQHVFAFHALLRQHADINRVRSNALLFLGYGMVPSAFPPVECASVKRRCYVLRLDDRANEVSAASNDGLGSSARARSTGA